MGDEKILGNFSAGNMGGCGTDRIGGSPKLNKHEPHDSARRYPVGGHEDWKQGELILFQGGNGEKTLFIKRIVGLPGDRAEAAQGRLTVNGQPWREGPLARVTVPDFPPHGFRRERCL